CSLHRDDDQGGISGHGGAQGILPDHGISGSGARFAGGGLGLPEGISSQGVVEMIRRNLLLAAILLTLVAITFADEAMTAWQWEAGITPPAGAEGVGSVTLSAEVLEQARDDLADLRLLDASGHEIPFALRVRREVNEVKRIQTREFNRAKAAGGVGELTVDLGENAGAHNEVEVDTGGQNFRRQVEL